MRCIFLFVFSLFILGSVTGQRISGRIVNSRGEPVEYVNVGIKNTQTGLVADGTGKFSIHIPDSLRDNHLLFSHLSYEPLRVPLSFLYGKVAAGEDIVVTLTEQAFGMRPVVVSPGRPRYRRFGKLFRSPAGYASYPELDTTDMGERSLERISSEIGTVYTVRERIWLNTITVHVSRCSLDSVLLRVNLFRFQDNQPVKELLFKPIYIMVRKDRNEFFYDIDMETDNIVLEPGEVAVGLDVVRLYGDPGGVMFMPNYSGGGYRRSLLSDFVQKRGMNPGIALYGRILPD